MMFPIGTFMSRMDAALTGSMDGIIAAMVAYMAAPVALCACLYYVMQGVRWANGDASVADGFWPQLAKVGIIIWLSTNLDTFNFWVRDLFFTGVPVAFAAVVSNTTGPFAGSLPATAAIFDNVWNQLWVVVGTVWMQIGFSVTGVLAGFTGLLAAIFGGGSLLVIAMVYVGARFVMAVVVCLMPALIACAMFEATKGIFERGVGKMVSLIILQVSGFIILQIVMLGNQWFMVQATNAILMATTNRAVFAEALQILLAVCVWFVGGAYTMWQARAVAYSIGTGIMIGGPSAYATATLLRSMRGGGNQSQSRDAPFNGGAGNMNLSINRAELPGGSGQAPLALPPPPPPALHHQNRS